MKIRFVIFNKSKLKIFQLNREGLNHIDDAVEEKSEAIITIVDLKRAEFWNVCNYNLKISLDTIEVLGDKIIDLR